MRNKRPLLALIPAIALGMVVLTPALAHGPVGGYGMAPGMMGRDYGMGPGVMGPGYRMIVPGYDRGGQVFSKDDVERVMEQRLGWAHNPNLKVGKVEERDEDTIITEIITKDGSLVRRFEVDRHIDFMRPEQ